MAKDSKGIPDALVINQKPGTVNQELGIGNRNIKKELEKSARIDLQGTYTNSPE